MHFDRLLQSAARVQSGRQAVDMTCIRFAHVVGFERPKKASSIVSHARQTVVNDVSPAEGYAFCLGAASQLQQFLAGHNGAFPCSPPMGLRLLYTACCGSLCLSNHVAHDPAPRCKSNGCSLRGLGYLVKAVMRSNDLERGRIITMLCLAACSSTQKPAYRSCILQGRSQDIRKLLCHFQMSIPADSLRVSVVRNETFALKLGIGREEIVA